MLPVRPTHPSSISQLKETKVANRKRRLIQYDHKEIQQNPTFILGVLKGNQRLEGQVCAHLTSFRLGAVLPTTDLSPLTHHHLAWVPSCKVVWQVLRAVQNFFQETSSPSGWHLFLLPEWIPVSLGSIVWSVCSQIERHKVSSLLPCWLQHLHSAHRCNFRFRAWARSERSLVCVWHITVFSYTGMQMNYSLLNTKRCLKGKIP